MSYHSYHTPLLLNENEQIVLAVDGRILPSLSDVIFILCFDPQQLLLPLLILHRIFRSITYVITTERIIAVEPDGKIDEIWLEKIVRMKGTKTSLMVHCLETKLWLSRLPDAWFFESVVWKVIDKVGHSAHNGHQGPKTVLCPPDHQAT